LLEEPQAAFYAWLEDQGDAWRSRIKVGDLVLVCDVGGGTTDFSLIMASEENGELTLKRVAVGDHILLGGDNMDLALARLLQQQFEASGQRVDTWQLHGLWHQCRMVKEKLFESLETQSHPITLLGKGTKHALCEYDDERRFTLGNLDRELGPVIGVRPVIIPRGQCPSRTSEISAEILPDFTFAKLIAVFFHANTIPVFPRIVRSLFQSTPPPTLCCLSPIIPSVQNSSCA
jgi:hypothetical protein